MRKIFDTLSGLVTRALGWGGTLLFSEGEGELRPGAFACVGLGVDNAR